MTVRMVNQALFSYASQLSRRMACRGMTQMQPAS